MVRVPPPSPTFAVSPGGTAIFAKAPCVLQEVRPPSLEMWNLRGRVCVANVIDAVGTVTTFAACYGFPLSHPDRAANEVYLRDVLSTMGGLRCCSVVLGDLNDHPNSSPVLSSSHVLGMFRVSDDRPTTLSKDGTLSGRDPLDHCLVNLVARDRGLKVKTDPTLRVSDHVPILVNLPVAHPRFLQVVWPSPDKLGKRRDNPVWNAEPRNFEDWQMSARNWIREAHEVERNGSMEVAFKEFVPQKPPKFVRFLRLLSLQRAVVELVEHPKGPCQARSILRKLWALWLWEWRSLVENPRELLSKVQGVINGAMKAHHRRSISKWRQLAKAWRVSDSAVFSYLRNPLPSKCLAFEVGHDVVTHPWQVQLHLLQFWQSLESWTLDQQNRAMEALEDKYSMLLPRSESSAVLLPRHLMDAAKWAGKSSAGLDGWTVGDVKALPIEAWAQFLRICESVPESLISSITTIFKRVPIPKGDKEACQPGDTRPIDVFSVLLRILATATTGQLYTWKMDVLHPGQCATKGGVVRACASLAWETECSLLGIGPRMGVSVDFTKMFNMMSPLVAIQAGMFMGLQPDYAEKLLFPFRIATGVWRLPYNAAPVPFRSGRGLPQGMSTSVLLAELSVSPLLWRVSRGLPGVSIWAYVDDLNMIACQREELDRVVGYLREFEDDFSLSLSVAKTKVWSSEANLNDTLALQTGFGATDVLEALGAQWPVNRKAKPDFPKELKRLDECQARLRRVRVLPMSLGRVAQVISVGCLSLLDYVNLM